MYLEVLDEF